MAPIEIGAIGLFALAGLIVLQIPIGFSMMLVGITGYAALGGWKAALSILATEPATVFSSLDLATVPLFLLMGTFATVAGFTADIYSAAAALFGHRRGGLGYATVGASAAFGVVCGSSTATAATFARSALPEMLQRGYSQSFATGVIAAGGTLKSLIPPSIVMILYSVAANVFIFDLFYAAIVPALIAVALNMATIAIVSRIRPVDAPTTLRIPWGDRIVELKQAMPAFALILAVFGGLYSGIFTVNEAASVAAVLSFVAAAARGRLNLRNIRDGLCETASATAMLYVILIGAFVFGHFITLARFPQEMAAFVNGLTIQPLAIVGVILLVYLFLGAIFDEISAMLITLPFVLPVIVSLGYDPVWWGVINVVVIELGMIIPPLGVIVFLLHGIARDIPLGTIYRGVGPFIAADLMLLAILTIFPAIALWLPTLTPG